VKEHCVNGHTKKTEHAVKTDQEKELDKPLEERKSEEEGVIRHSAKCRIS